MFYARCVISQLHTDGTAESKKITGGGETLIKTVFIGRSDRVKLSVPHFSGEQLETPPGSLSLLETWLENHRYGLALLYYLWCD